MTITAHIVAIVICAALSVRAGGPARILDINARVQVSDSHVKLADLVSDPGQLTDSERNLVVTEAPGHGGTRRISLKGLAYMLQKFPSLLDVSVRGPHFIAVIKTMDVAAVNRAKLQIVDFLKQSDPWRGWTIDVLFSADDERTLGQSGAFDTLEPVTVETDATLGRVPLRVRFFDDQKLLVSEATIAPVVMRQVEAVVLNDLRERGHLLTEADLGMSTIWVGAEKRLYCSDQATCLGRELKRRLRAGTMLSADDLAEPMDARRGDLVWVTAQSGSLNVRLPVIALESGRRGENVRVRNRASDKEFKVELVGPREGVLGIGS